VIVPEELDQIGVPLGDLGPVELEVHVTADHIANGVVCSSAACPIALAVLDVCRVAGFRLTPTLNAGVSTTSIFLYRHDNTHFYGQLPPEARDFITAYDAAGPGAVRPFEFWLRLVSR